MKKNNFAKLSIEDVSKIKLELANNVRTILIAKKFNIHRSTVYRIKIGAAWADLGNNLQSDFVYNRNKYLKQEVKDKIYLMFFDEKISMTDISKKLNINRGTIATLIRNKKIKDGLPFKVKHLFVPENIRLEIKTLYESGDLSIQDLKIRYKYCRQTIRNCIFGDKRKTSKKSC